MTHVSGDEASLPVVGSFGTLDPLPTRFKGTEGPDPLSELFDGEDTEDPPDPSPGVLGSVPGVVVDVVDEVELASEYGANADELSAWWGTEEGSRGDDLLVLGGYGGVADHLAEGLDIRLGAAVRTVSSNDDGAELTFDNDETFSCDRVVVTVPLGVLATGDISFNPPLPDSHQNAIDTMRMGLLDKVWCVFPKQFWSNESLIWNRVDEPGAPFREWYNLAPLTGRPVLLALNGGRTARAWAERSDDEMRVAAMSALQEFIDAGW